MCLSLTFNLVFAILAGGLEEAEHDPDQADCDMDPGGRADCIVSNDAAMEVFPGLAWTMALRAFSHNAALSFDAPSP